jgi:hypothetical protein
MEWNIICCINSRFDQSEMRSRANRIETGKREEEESGFNEAGEREKSH